MAIVWFERAGVRVGVNVFNIDAIEAYSVNGHAWCKVYLRNTAIDVPAGYDEVEVAISGVCNYRSGGD